MPSTHLVPAFLSPQGPLVAIICDVFGEKTASLLGAFLVSGGYLISSWATGIPFLCVTMGVLPGESTVKRLEKRELGTSLLLATCPKGLVS